MKVHIIGEDQRSNYLRTLYDNNIVSIKEAETIICPIPFTRDNIKINNSNMSIEELINIPDIEFKKIYTGALNSFAKEKLNEKNIKVIDIMEDEAYAIKNAIATAEGAIKKVIDSTPFTINKSNVLILGYGRIGKILARFLSSFGARIYVEARSKKDIALIKSMGYNEVELERLEDYLPIANIAINTYNEVELERLEDYLPIANIAINTIPSMILDKNKVDLLDSNSYVLDLASSPGGVDFEALKTREINTCWYLGVPSKDSPLTAAKYIKETIDEIDRGNEKWEKKSM